MKIELTTKNRLFTVRRNPPLKFFMTDRLTRWQRIQRKLAKLPLKPHYHTHHADAGGPRAYRIKQTHEVNWFGFDFLFTRRFPLTAEQRAQWTSPSHLTDSTALKHY